MKWIMLAWLAGSLVVSDHDTEEACEGRKAMVVKEKNVTTAKCVLLSQTITLSNGTISTPAVVWGR